jgi:hypothetical protein
VLFRYIAEQGSKVFAKNQKSFFIVCFDQIEAAAQSITVSI